MPCNESLLHQYLVHHHLPRNEMIVLFCRICSPPAYVFREGLPIYLQGYHQTDVNDGSTQQIPGHRPFVVVAVFTDVPLHTSLKLDIHHSTNLTLGVRYI